MRVIAGTIYLLALAMRYGIQDMVTSSRLLRGYKIS
jgi:hypothetical protein